jgi:membrane protein YdbS with pleckstrin-like domain
LEAEMDAHAHLHEHDESLERMALSATLHCLTGCAIGEVVGVIIGTALGWSNQPTIALAIVLAFVFGYSLTSLPLLRAPAWRWPWSPRSRSPRTGCRLP